MKLEIQDDVNSSNVDSGPRPKQKLEISGFESTNIAKERREVELTTTIEDSAGDPLKLKSKKIPFLDERLKETPPRECCDFCQCWVEWAIPSVLATSFAAVLVNLFARAYMTYEKWQYTRSVYFTVCTMTTLGYGDFAADSPTGIWISIILIYTSATFLLAIFQYLASAVSAIGPCLVLNCLTGPCRELIKAYCCGCFNCCGINKDNWLEEDLSENYWGVMEKIEERVCDDPYYKELKKNFTQVMFSRYLTRDGGLMSLKLKPTDTIKVNFVKFLNKTYSAKFEADSVKKKPCFNIEDGCLAKKLKIACKPSECWTFLNVTALYFFWFVAWISYFTGQINGTCDETICDLDDYQWSDLTDDSLSTIVSESSDIDGFESVLLEYDVSLVDPSCVNLSSVVSSNDLFASTAEPDDSDLVSSTAEFNAIGCSNHTSCKKKDYGEFDWELAFYFGVVTSSTVGYGDYSGYGGDIKMTHAQIEFITYMQVPGIVLFAAWVGIFSSIYLNWVYVIAVYLCCEPRKPEGCCCQADIRCGWCVSVYDRLYYEKIVQMQHYYAAVGGSADLFNRDGTMLKVRDPNNPDRWDSVEMEWGSWSVTGHTAICCQLCSVFAKCRDNLDTKRQVSVVDEENIRHSIILDE